MAQIINGQPNLGGLLGQGLSEGISQLASHKLRSMIQQSEKRRSIDSLKKAGFSDSEADFLSNYPAEVQAKYLLPLLGQGSDQEPQQQSMGQMLSGQGQQQGQPDVNQLLSGLGNGQEAPNASQFLTSGNVPELVKNQLAKSKVQGLGGLPTEVTPKKEPEIELQKALQQDQQAPQEVERPKTVAEQLKKPRTSAADIKQQREKEKEDFKATQKYVDKITRDHDAADFAQPRLNKMKKLIEKGGLPISSFYKIVKNIEDHTGHGIGGAITGSITSILGPILSQIQRTTSPNTEAFEKQTAGFLRGAKDIFGGRFTNEEMKAYLDMIPKLTNTDKGKLDVIDDFSLFNKASNLKYKIMEDIIRENKGKRPYNLSELVEQRAKPQLDKLSDIFKEDLASYATRGA